MNKFLSGIVLLSLTLAAVVTQQGFAQNANVTEAEAKMFAVSAGYERFMGRWSRLLAPAYVAFAGVKNGDRVLDVGTGTGSLAAAVEASMPASCASSLERRAVDARTPGRAVEFPVPFQQAPNWPAPCVWAGGSIKGWPNRRAIGLTYLRAATGHRRVSVVRFPSASVVRFP